MTKLLTLEDCGTVDTKPVYTPYGYVITDSGTIISLSHPWFHGIVLAILYPDIAKEQGYKPPVHPLDDNNVVEYQRFELDNHDKFPVFRISFRSLSGMVNVSRGKQKPTPTQLTALKKVMNCIGIRPHEKVQLELSEERLLNLYKILEQENAIH